MNCFDFKSVYDLDSVREFAEELTYEIVCSKEEAPSIEDVLTKFGYPCPDVEMGDYDEDFNLDIENDFEYDIIDAYEEAARLRMKQGESGSTNSQQDVARNDDLEEEPGIKERSDDDGGTNEEESAT